MVSNVHLSQNPLFSSITLINKKCNDKNIAMVDDFKTVNIKVDADLKPDITHGDAVEMFIKSGLPDANIDKFHTTVDEISVRDALNSILQSDKKYDAVNISKSSDISYKELSKLVGKRITPKNISANKEFVKQKLFKSNYPEVGYIEEINKNLESLIKSGTKVYIASGNKGKKSLNLYTLADGVEVVGALKDNGKRANFSTINSLVKRHEKGVFKVKKAVDSEGKKGFDFTQNNAPDVLEQQTTSIMKFPFFTVSGTSFAAPQALIKDLQN